MIKFGTGGWRAVIGDEFTKENIQILAKALADKMHAEKATEKGIVLGYDRRFLSKEAMQWAVGAGILSSTTPGALVLEPQSSATRAQVAVMLEKFAENFL